MRRACLHLGLRLIIAFERAEDLPPQGCRCGSIDCSHEGSGERVRGLGQGQESYTRVTHVLHTCYTRVTHVLHMCVKFHAAMCYTCVTHVCKVSCGHVLHMCYTCVTHVLHMCVKFHAAIPPWAARTRPRA